MLLADDGVVSRWYLDHGGQNMPRFRYRSLRVGLWDTWFTDGGRKRGGDEPDRLLTVADSEVEAQIDFADQRGDDYAAFRERSWAHFMSYLNELGDSGWQVVSFDCPSSQGSIPVGNILLVGTE
jgi:hypothetical protein